MAASSWKLTLDRAVRYAVSDGLASVKSYVYDLEYTQRRSTQEIAAWNNYLRELRELHQLLLTLPNLEKAEWLSDDQIIGAPTFTPFMSGITDAKTNVRKVHSWLFSLLQSGDLAAAADQTSVSLEQEYYTHQVDQVLKQLQLLPAPGSDTWYTKYQPVEAAKPAVAQPSLAVAA
ncbi:MAG: hypothetical protein ACFB2W_09615 [Leptolyngbyaceae cyanobacterium]